MSKIKIKANDSTLTVTARPVITSGCKNLNTVSVILDKTWLFDDARYYFNFYREDDTHGIIREMEISGNTGECVIPFGAAEKEGFFHFGIFSKTEQGDIIKASEPIAYEVKKGISTESLGELNEYAFEVKRRLIRLMNANSSGLNLNENMSYDDIDMNYTSYMNEKNAAVSVCTNSIAQLGTMIKEYVNPDLLDFGDILSSSVIYLSELNDYLINQEQEIGTDASEEINLFLSEENNILQSLYTLYTGGNVNA